MATETHFNDTLPIAPTCVIFRSFLHIATQYFCIFIPIAWLAFPSYFHALDFRMFETQ